jgi:hypothetical protein
MPIVEGNPIPITASSQSRPDEHRLRIDFITQYPSQNLCWAACGAMVINYKGENYRNGANLTLLRVVADMQGPDCVPGGASIVRKSKCDCARKIMDVYVAYTFLPASHIDSSCNDNEYFNPTPDLLLSIVEAIKGDQPVQVHWQWKNGSGHTILIVGYRGAGDLPVNEPNLLIYDPLHKTGEDNWLSFNDVINATGKGQWVGWYSNFGV